MVDNNNPKIAVSDLEKLEELLDQTPTHRNTVVSKREAIGRLAPKLHAMRSKGYSWSAVAAWLTEHGLAVSTAVLSGYMRHAPDRNAGATTRHRKANRPHIADTAAVVSPPAPSADQRVAAPSPEQRGVSASKPAAKEPPARRGEHGARRSEFAVRPDSDDI
jgi:hypothetical protein